MSRRRCAGPRTGGGRRAPAPGPGSGLFACSCLAALVGLAGCSDPVPSAASDRRVATAAADTAPAADAGAGSPPRFVDVTAELGLDFVHRTGSEGSYPMPAIMGGGAAVFDYDGDGRLDLYLVQGGDRFPADGGATGIGNRLFRQRPDGRFEDATDAAGVGHRGYGMGAAVGDIDNDGDLDLFVTNWGANALYRNDGDGTFTDWTREAGVAGDGGWSTSAVFADLDHDGLVDLFVARYVDFDPGRECAVEGGRLDYCGPAQFHGLADRLYRNLGGGRFEDRSRESGIARAEEAGLGVVALDLDADGNLDLYVANDADPNSLWLGDGALGFVDAAVVTGLAFNRYGVPEAGMGLVQGDADGDGDLDLFVSHLIEETNTFYENLGAAGFEDTTARRGLALPSVPYTGFGDTFADFDCDGDLDLAVVNGGVKRRPSALAPEGWFWSAYAEPAQLYDNGGDGSFTDRSDAAGDFTATPRVGRGLIAADLDSDGDLDLVATAIEGPARIFRNDGGNARAWLEVRLVDPRYRRDAVGAELRVETATRQLLRAVSLSDGYLSSRPAAVHVGLGEEERVERFEVRWPDGRIERFPGVEARRSIELRRGAGEGVR